MTMGTLWILDVSTCVRVYSGLLYYRESTKIIPNGPYLSQGKVVISRKAANFLLCFPYFPDFFVFFLIWSGYNKGM